MERERGAPCTAGLQYEPCVGVSLAKRKRFLSKQHHLLARVVLCIGGVSFSIVSLAQTVVYQFDLEAGTRDSIVFKDLDTTVTQGKTSFHYGLSGFGVTQLPQSPPSENTYPGAALTYKRTATDLFDLHSYPIRTSVKLFKIENDPAKDLCSGSMISRRHVLTAAHCVSLFDAEKIEVDRAKACAVYNEVENEHFGCADVEKIYLFKERNSGFTDIAILELSENLGDQSGWIGAGFQTNDDSLAKGVFFKFSYPNGTIPWDSTTYEGDVLYYNYGVPNVFSESSFGFKSASGIPGESGSSMTQVANNSDYTTYGVLSYSGNLSHTRIGREHFNAIEQIVKNDLTIGIEKPMQAASIYPNPTSDLLSITDILHKNDLLFEIYDTHGRRVLSEENFYPFHAINVKHLSKGIYSLLISDGEEVSQYQLIKM